VSDTQYSSSDCTHVCRSLLGIVGVSPRDGAIAVSGQSLDAPESASLKEVDAKPLSHGISTYYLHFVPGEHETSINPLVSYCPTLTSSL
jgi:hypothetical protein